MEWKKGKFTISTDRKRMSIDVIHGYLSERSYWAVGRSKAAIRKSIRHSLAFGIFHGKRQIGFARAITDYATFVWIADVFVLEEYRGQGLSKWLMEVMIAHPRLQKFRRWVLATKDAQELYRRYGFEELKRPERWMERHDPACEEQADYWKPDQGSGALKKI